MKGSKHPIRNTILYGLVCGLAFIPVALTLNAVIPWSLAVGLTLWLGIEWAGYYLLSGAVASLIALFIVQRMSSKRF